VAPFVFYARERRRRGRAFTFLYGARTGAELIALPDLPADRLHLASAVTAIGPRRLVGTAAGFESLDAAGPDVAPGHEVERILVPDSEPGGANVLALGGRCIMAAGNPVTAAALRAAGESVVEIDLEEFARADGGPTCLVAIVP